MPGVPLDNIEQVWPIAAKYFEEAAKEIDESFSLDYYKNKCLSGNYLLWIGRNGKVAVILEVSEYPNGQECDIVMLAGDGINSWIDELAEIEDWARRSGCNRMILTGRKGWVKILSDYKIKTLTMVKSL